MVLHIKWAHVETERQTVLYSKQFGKLFHHVSCGGTHSANSQPLGDWDAKENRMDKGEGNTEFGQDAAICLWEAIFVKFQMCCYHVTFDLDLDIEDTLDASSPGDHRVQVWSRYSHLSGRRSDLRKMFTDGRTDGRRTIAKLPKGAVASCQ